MGKEAVVVIIDVNETMNQPFVSSESTSDNDTPTKTRLDVAKQVAIDIIADLMIQSKTNEVMVLALHTKETKNFLCSDKDYRKNKDEDENDDDENDNMGEDGEEDDDKNPRPYRNMVDFSSNGNGMGIKQPLPPLLRKINSLQVPEDGRNIRGGDFITGICYAADALHQRTARKNSFLQFQRRIILLTDAEHKITVDSRLLSALDMLRAMETRLEVVGMNFESSGDFDTAAPAPKVKTEPSDTQTPGEEDNDNDDSGSETDDGSETDASEEGDSLTDMKRENEKCLLSLADKTGGFVFAANELQAMFDKILGRRVISPSKQKLIFEIAPDNVLEDVRSFLLLQKRSTPSSLKKKKRLAMVDSNNQPRKNGNGDDMFEDLETIYQYIEPETGEDVDEEKLADAYKFGADFIGFSQHDASGLEVRSPRKLSIVGYAELEHVPEYLRIGPPYVLTGHDSRRCCAGISALARALRRTNKVAIATFVKTANRDPILCGLFPLEDGDDPLRLLIMRLPFASDVKGFLQLSSLDGVAAKENPKAAEACDNLIDNLILPDGVLEYTMVPNPKLRSMYKTVIGRVVHKEDGVDVPVVDVRGASKNKIMETPMEITDKAKPAVDSFYNAFSLKTE